jgi:glycosyltransferase involved in cell wall biosynthesis
MPRRLRVLHAIHDFLPRHQAGSEIYAAELCAELTRRGHHVTVLAASFDPSRRHGELVWRIYDGLPVVEIINNWSFTSFEETYRATNLLKSLDHVLTATAPDVLHVHNLLNLSFELPALAKRRGARIVGTLHDHTLVCPSGGQRLHRADRYVCRVIDPQRCSRCFSESPFPSQMAFGRALERPGGSVVHRVAHTLRRRAPQLLARLARASRWTPATNAPSAAQIERRLQAARTTAAGFDLLVAPSPSIAGEFQALGVVPARLHVSDYGFLPLPRADPRQIDDAAPLRIGYVGTLAWHKGVHVLIDAVRDLPPGEVEVRIFGDLETFPDYSAEIQRSARHLPVQFMGRFERQDIAAIYAQFDVLAVPSLWLENSPLVIHEAFMAGLPVVAARIGGIADLVQHDVNGLLYPAESSAALSEALAILSRDRGRLRRLGGHRSPVVAMHEHAAEWERLYATVTKEDELGRLSS